MVNHHAHASAHCKQHGLLPFKVSALSNQVSKAGTGFKYFHGFFSSIHGVVGFDVFDTWINEATLLLVEASHLVTFSSFIYQWFLFFDSNAPC